MSSSTRSHPGLRVHQVAASRFAGVLAGSVALTLGTTAAVDVTAAPAAPDFSLVRTVRMEANQRIDPVVSAELAQGGGEVHAIVGS